MTIRKPSLVAALAALVILTMAPTAHAGGSIFGGVNFPTGDFDEGAKTGWSLGGYYTGKLLPIVELGGLVAYNDFSIGATNLPGFETLSDSSVNAWEIEALGQVNVLFMRGFVGLGLANHSGIDESGNSKRKTNFAWQLGLSAKILFLEGRLAYHQITADTVTPNWVSLTVGITF